jgi:hypothetical protein
VSSRGECNNFVVDADTPVSVDIERAVASIWPRQRHKDKRTSQISKHVHEFARIGVVAAHNGKEFEDDV